MGNTEFKGGDEGLSTGHGYGDYIFFGHALADPATDPIPTPLELTSYLQNWD